MKHFNVTIIIFEVINLIILKDIPSRKKMKSAVFKPNKKYITNITSSIKIFSFGPSLKFSRHHNFHFLFLMYGWCLVCTFCSNPRSAVTLFHKSIFLKIIRFMTWKIITEILKLASLYSRENVTDQKLSSRTKST